jgi:signal transduction histidine kinase
VRSAAGVVYAFRDVTDERRLEEEKSDFVATISHELRTPMTGVYGAALTLLRTDIHLSAGQREALLQMIATQAARLGQIVDEVLLTRQLDRGEVHVERTPIDVGHVVRSAVETLQAQLLVEQEIEVEVDERARVASGDPDRIQQVLVNLIDNALKYGATPVKVAAQPADARVRISVSDAGTGVPPADRERIFEKFYRARGRPLPTAGGTGLGLYIARELTERMGGRLQLASKPGQGATFVVELRRADRSG